MWTESVKYRGLQSGDEGGTDGHFFLPFFVADSLKLALEEPHSTNFPQLTSHVHC